MAQKNLRIYLDREPASIEDNSLFSPDYFGFEEDSLPDFFRLGINNIISKPNIDNLKTNSEIRFEAIDADGYALPFTVDETVNSADKIVLKLKVSKDTPIYDLILYFIGTLKNGLKVRWSRIFTVNREGVKTFGSDSGSLVNNSFFIGKAVGEGLELRGGENPILRSAGYKGFNAATASLGPSGFMLYSGSALKGTSDNYEGVGFEIAASGSNRFLKMRSAFTIPGGAGFAPTTSPVFDIGLDNLNVNGNVRSSATSTASFGKIETTGDFEADGNISASGYIISEKIQGTNNLVIGPGDGNSQFAVDYLASPSASTDWSSETGDMIITPQRRVTIGNGADLGVDGNITATTASVKYLMIDKTTIPQADPVVAGAIFVDPLSGTLRISGFS